MRESVVWTNRKCLGKKVQEHLNVNSNRPKTLSLTNDSYNLLCTLHYYPQAHIFKANSYQYS
jgi:hypothetical protein